MLLYTTQLIAAAALLAPSAQALSVKADPMAAHGCLAKVSLTDAEAAIKRFDLQTDHARESEIRALGTALVWIEKLNDNRPLESANAEGKYRYRYVDAVGHSHEAATEVLIKRNGAKNYGENVAQLVHELGHLIGNHGEYGNYRKFVHDKMCVVSEYSNDKWNEQFAEVFAAFVTRPKLLRKSSQPQCQRAFQFFAQHIFKNAGPAALRCMDQQESIADEHARKAGRATKPPPPPAPQTPVAPEMKPDQKTDEKPD